MFPVAIEQFDLDAYDLVDQFEPLRREGRARARPRAAPLLLPFARCGTRGTSSTPTSGRRASAALGVGGAAAHARVAGALGCRDRAARAPVRRQLPLRRGAHPPLLRAPRGRRLPARRHRVLSARRDATRAITPWSCRRWCPTSESISRSTPAGARASRCASSASGPTGNASSGRRARRSTFLGQLPDEAIRDEYRSARAVILAGEEDFGIVPVEAQACGRPVVAFGRGGALETVIDGETGVLFADATAESLAAGLERAATRVWDRRGIRAHAERFSRARFAERCSPSYRTRWPVHAARAGRGRTRRRLPAARKLAVTLASRL